MKCKQTIGAVIFVAASGALYYFLTKNQGDAMEKKKVRMLSW